jgi:hypothetical protein
MRPLQSREAAPGETRTEPGKPNLAITRGTPRRGAVWVLTIATHLQRPMAYGLWPMANGLWPMAW